MTSLDADAAVHDDDYDNVDDELPRPPRPPPMPTASEVLACQFSSWYHAFRDMDHHHHNDDDDDDASVVDDDARWRMRRKRRRNATIESTIIRPLPSEFVDYLLSDGVRLPSCATKVSSCMNDDADVVDVDRDDGLDGDGGDGGIVDDDDVEEQRLRDVRSQDGVINTARGVIINEGGRALTRRRSRQFIYRHHS